jgi:hypothetical protein
VYFLFLRTRKRLASERRSPVRAVLAPRSRAKPLKLKTSSKVTSCWPLPRQCSGSGTARIRIRTKKKGGHGGSSWSRRERNCRLVLQISVRIRIKKWGFGSASWKAGSGKVIRIRLGVIPVWIRNTAPRPYSPSYVVMLNVKTSKLGLLLISTRFHLFKGNTVNFSSSWIKLDC